MRRRKTLQSRFLAGSAALALGCISGRGAEILNQGFESLSAGDLNGQAGYSAMAQADVVSGGLSYSNGAVAFPGGTKCVAFTGLTPANNWVFSRTFPAQSGTVYFALVMTWTGQGDNDMLLFALSNDADGSPVALANSAGVYINRNLTFMDGLISARMRGNSTADTTAISTGKAGGNSTSSPQLIVGSLSKTASASYNTLRLWVNPSTFTMGPPDATVTRDIGLSSGLDTLLLFSGASNENDEVVKVDNIRIGTAWADVMPFPRRGTVVTVW